MKIQESIFYSTNRARPGFAKVTVKQFPEWIFLRNRKNHADSAIFLIGCRGLTLCHGPTEVGLIIIAIREKSGQILTRT